jgi:hypothetical protein
MTPVNAQPSLFLAFTRPGSYRFISNSGAVQAITLVKMALIFPQQSFPTSFQLHCPTNVHYYHSETVRQFYGHEVAVSYNYKYTWTNI